MSHHEPEKYLYDMLSSCEFLLEFTGTAGTGKEFTLREPLVSNIELSIPLHLTNHQSPQSPWQSFSKESVLVRVT